MSGQPTAGRSASSGAAQVAAMQSALAAEHAAVFGYGVAGGRLTGARLALAQRDWAEHQAARDTLAAMLAGRGATPAVAAVDYPLPFRVHNTRTAAALAVWVEDTVTTAYLGLVALTEPSLREFGARAVESAALRATVWRGRTVAFPGLGSPPVSRRAGS